jgi:hypothetical protein
MEKVENSTVLIYIDCSGSTGNSRSYWNKIKTVIDQAQKDYKEVKYFFWDNNSYEVSRLDVNNRIMKMTVFVVVTGVQNVKINQNNIAERYLNVY